VAQLGAGAVLDQGGVLERLADALTKPSALNETVIQELEARSAGFHLLEDLIPAQGVLKLLTLHLREVSTLLSGRASDPHDELRRRLVVTAGESSLLAGWSASALGDPAAARSFYDTAIKAAGEARDAPITACALTYRSYIPSAKQLLAARGSDPATEAEIAAAAADLLDRAGRGPGSGPDELAAPQQHQAAGQTRSPRSRRVRGRTAATAAPAWPRPASGPVGDEDSAGGPGPGADGRTEQPAETETGTPPAQVIPLPLFDARKEAEKWW
jgi:hypothetical protein